MTAKEELFERIKDLQQKREEAKNMVLQIECQINILMNKVRAMQETQEVPAGMIRVKQDITRLNKGDTVIIRKAKKEEKEKRSIII